MISASVNGKCMNCGGTGRVGDAPCFMCSQQGIKLDEGKIALDLIDPFFEEEFAAVLTKGAFKYAPGNWEKGMSIKKALAGVKRHLLEIRKGNFTDPEWGLSHAAHAACGLMFIHFYVRQQINVPDDRWVKK